MVKGTREEAVDRIKQALHRYFLDRKEGATVVVGPSDVSDNIHVMVVSDTFRNKEQVQRDTPLYDYLKKQVDQADIVKVSLLLTLTPEEYDQHSSDIPEISGTFAYTP